MVDVGPREAVSGPTITPLPVEVVRVVLGVVTELGLFEVAGNAAFVLDDIWDFEDLWIMRNLNIRKILDSDLTADDQTPWNVSGICEAFSNWSSQ